MTHFQLIRFATRHNMIKSVFCLAQFVICSLRALVAKFSVKNMRTVMIFILLSFNFMNNPFNISKNIQYVYIDKNVFNILSAPIFLFYFFFLLLNSFLRGYAESSGILMEINTFGNFFEKLFYHGNNERD